LVCYFLSWILEVFAWSDNRNTDAFSGVGCDAKVALDIHNLREENPERFYSQVIPACLLPDPLLCALLSLTLLLLQFGGGPVCFTFP
jgi:hypothetical protein